MKLSQQAQMSIMMVLQRSLLEQEDIIPMLNDLDFTLSDGLLAVNNPPVLDLSKTKEPVLKKAFDHLSVSEE